MSYVRVPPDSTGKKVYHKQATVGADTVEVPVTHLADAADPEKYLKIDVRGSASVRFAEGQPILSGFGALKTTHQEVLGVYDPSSGSYDDLFTVTEAVGATNVYDDVAHSHMLSTTTSNGSSVIKTTNRYHYYLPGSSMLFIGTLAFGDTGKAGNTRRFGLYDDNDGVFFELYETTLNAVIRNSGTGSVVDTKIPKSSWNVDKLDGTGPSGLTIDITNINLFWIDYQWLGGGRVRFGIYEANGSRLVCHEVYHAGLGTVPYMRTGTLPYRSENTNFSATGSVSQLREVCIGIYVEGKTQDYTFWRSADMNATGVTCSSNTHILSMRSKTVISNNHNSVVTYPETLNVYTTQPVSISLYQNTTLTGGSWAISGDNAIEGSLDGTLNITGMIPFKTIYFDIGATSVSLSEFFEVNDEAIQLNADDTYQIWSVVGTKLGALDAVVTLNIGYRELW